MSPFRTGVMGVSLIVVSVFSSDSSSQTLTLRNLESVDATRISFDEDAIVTAKGRRIWWDHVLRGTVKPSQQQQFDRLLADIGTPLFRIRHRLAVGDYEALAETSEKLLAQYPQTSPNEKNCRAMFLASVGSYFARIENGKREHATLALIQASQLVIRFPELKNEQLPKDLTVREIEACFAQSLPPIWFGKNSAATTFSKLQDRYWKNDAPEWQGIRDGNLVYAASLAIAAENVLADDCLDELRRRSSTICKSWLPILQAYQELVSEQPGIAIATLEKNLVRLTGAQRAVAQYLSGLSNGLLNKQYDTGMLKLLYVPAVFGDRFRHISSAALFHAAKFAASSEHHLESKSLKLELKNRYPNSHHAKLFRSK